MHSKRTISLLNESLAQVFLAWDTQFQDEDEDDAFAGFKCSRRATAARRDGGVDDSRKKRGTRLEDGHRGFVALKSVTNPLAGGRGGRSGMYEGDAELSKGLFRELRALQMLDCVHVVRLLDVYPEVTSCECVHM